MWKDARPSAVTRVDAATGVVMVAGDFDIRAADDVAAAARDLEDAGAPLIVFDLDAVEFMDSAALAVLIGARERARERGGRVVVRAEHGPARDLLRLVGLTELLDDAGGGAPPVAG